MIPLSSFSGAKGQLQRPHYLQHRTLSAPHCAHAQKGLQAIPGEQEAAEPKRGQWDGVSNLNIKLRCLKLKKTQIQVLCVVRTAWQGSNEGVRSHLETKLDGI